MYTTIMHNKLEKNIYFVFKFGLFEFFFSEYDDDDITKHIYLNCP